MSVECLDCQYWSRAFVYSGNGFICCKCWNDIPLQWKAFANMWYKIGYLASLKNER